MPIIKLGNGKEVEISDESYKVLAKGLEKTWIDAIREFYHEHGYFLIIGESRVDLLVSIFDNGTTKALLSAAFSFGARFTFIAHKNTLKLNDIYAPPSYEEMRGRLAKFYREIKNAD